MARLARVIVPGLPHHVTQRGNRLQPIFFAGGDQAIYRDLLAEQTRRRGVEVWAYCLMPNHVHLILTPQDVPMDEDHLLAAARYVPLNPVRARLVARPQDWP
jgi:putative transposase